MKRRETSQCGRRAEPRPQVQEKDKGRRAQAAAAEKERLAAEVKKFEDQTQAEAADRDKTLAQMRQGVQARLKEIKALCPNQQPRNVERAAKALAERGRLQPHPKTRGCYCRPIQGS